MAAGPPGSVHLSTARLPVCHSKTRAERRQSGGIGWQLPARPPNSSAAHRTKYAMCAASAAFGRDRSGALGAPRPWWWWWTGTNSRAHTACCRYSRRSVARFRVHCCYFVLWSCHGGKRGGYTTTCCTCARGHWPPPGRERQTTRPRAVRVISTYIICVCSEICFLFLLVG